MKDPTQRFADRVADYIRYRPSYPAATLEALIRAGALDPADLVADVGAGTGKLSELLLRNGNRVLGVEPNRQMREAGEQLLRHYPEFRGVDGRAEATTLEDRSVDVVAAGQAFHWFDPRPTRREFARILREGGRIVLVWNDRKTDAGEFMRGYEDLLARHGTDYKQANHHSWVDEALLSSFFETGGMSSQTLPNRQLLDRGGLRGRLRSCSYVPGPGRPGHVELLEAADALFAAHEVEGRVCLEYDTRLYFGLPPAA